MLNNLSLKAKLLGGFGFVSSLIVVVTLVATAGFSDLTRENAFARAIGEASANLLEARIYQIRFEESSDPQQAEMFANSMEKSQGQLDIASSLVDEPEEIELIDRIRTELKSYSQNFSEFEKLEEQKNTSRNTRSALGALNLAKIREAVDLEDSYIKRQINSGRRVGSDLFDKYQKMTQIRYAINRANLSAKDYTFRPTQQNLDAINKELETASVMFKTLISRIADPTTKQVLQEAEQAMLDYRDEINTYSGLIEKQEQLAEVMVASAQSASQTAVESQKTSLINATAARNLASNLIMIVTIIAVIIAFVLAWFLTSHIVKGTDSIVKLLDGLALEGNLDQRVSSDLTARKDAIGRLGRSMQKVLADYTTVGKLAAELAEGNWDQDIHVKSDLDRMNISLKSMVEEVNQSLHSVNDTVQRVSAEAEELSAASQALSQGATEQAASLEEISSSMTEIAAQTNQNAETARQAEQISGQTSKSAEDGKNKMTSLKESIENITIKAAETQKVIKVIDDIAFQTNLLALNAAVEAARAGQHGKGFAVVAEEVRNLAGRSAKAAKETAELIESVVGVIQNGNLLAGETSDSLNTMVSKISEVSVMVQEIASASSEQAAAVEQVSTGLEQIDQVTQQNTASAEETASSATEMTAQANGLAGTVAKFRLAATLFSATSSSKKNLPPPSRPSKSLPGRSRATVNTNSPMNLTEKYLFNTEQIDLSDDAGFGKY